MVEQHKLSLGLLFQLRGVRYFGWLNRNNRWDIFTCAFTTRMSQQNNSQASFINHYVVWPQFAGLLNACGRTKFLRGIVEGVSVSCCCVTNHHQASAAETIGIPFIHVCRSLGASLLILTELAPLGGQVVCGWAGLGWLSSFCFHV